MKAFITIVFLGCVTAWGDHAIFARSTQGRPGSPIVPPRASATKPVTKPPVAPRLNINSATKDEIMKVLGIGSDLAAKIVAGRPYKSKADLQNRRLMPTSAYLRITSKIVVKQSR